MESLRRPKWSWQTVKGRQVPPRWPWRKRSERIKMLDFLFQVNKSQISKHEIFSTNDEAHNGGTCVAYWYARPSHTSSFLLRREMRTPVSANAKEYNPKGWSRGEENRKVVRRDTASLIQKTHKEKVGVGCLRQDDT